MRTTLGHFFRSNASATNSLRVRCVTRAGGAMLALAIAACGPSKPMTPAQQGRIVYMTNCVVCHNPDPNLAGSQGPPIAGSSRELVNDRVLNLKYPPGYTPKRTTHAMRALPQLANQIDNLTAFLAEAANQKK
ncbi:MAG TPA: c-type cytochrome [Candidatus Acidoferrales bacterium]|nr:c-type cytochrome [Candidatus Acidoferrales bacterium]